MLKKTHTFTFMGTGAGCGVPAFFCECAACEEARVMPRARRGCCGVMIEGEKRLLIDTPPDTRHQLEREGARHIDRLIFSHAHYDHISGLGEFEYMIRLVTGENLVVSGSDEALNEIRKEFGYLDYTIDYEEIKAFDTIDFDGVRYTALPVSHAGGAFGYLLETPNSRLFYASDTGELPEETRARIRGIDHFAIDATFWKHCWTPKVHNSVQSAIEQSLELGVGTTYLTHLSMHYDEPITLIELEKYLEQYEGRVVAAHDGLKISL